VCCFFSSRSGLAGMLYYMYLIMTVIPSIYPTVLRDCLLLIRALRWCPYVLEIVSKALWCTNSGAIVCCQDDILILCFPS
jgi:hypothetical protein